VKIIHKSPETEGILKIISYEKGNSLYDHTHKKKLPFQRVKVIDSPSECKVRYRAWKGLKNERVRILNKYH